MDFNASDFDYEDDRSPSQCFRDAYAFAWDSLIDPRDSNPIARINPRTIARRLEIKKEIERMTRLADAIAVEKRKDAACRDLSEINATRRLLVIPTAAAPDLEAEAIGLSDMCLTPRLLAQRPQAARVLAGLLTR
ncbi:MAG: hypothetical protein U7M05_11790 [Candidatus Igneacidithiobacillus chanchocoensis]